MKPLLILESDCHLLLDTSIQGYKEVEKLIQRFSDHIKTCGKYEQYFISPLSVWNALALGIRGEKILQTLHTYTCYPIPVLAELYISKWIDRFSKLTLVREGESFCLLTGDEQTLSLLYREDALFRLVIKKTSKGIMFDISDRGRLKQSLVRLGYNVIDQCGYDEGESLSFELLDTDKQTNEKLELRDYQRKAVAAFHRDRIGGSGVIVLPCGTGKTLTGIGVMASLQYATLIITSNVISCEQWKDEIINKTSISMDSVGIYGGNKREVKPITIATYHILSYQLNGHQNGQQQFPHMDLFSRRNWGLIIYDEVHLLPAPVFRMTASIQATRRLGLTATLIREDGCAPDVYSLVGAKLFDYQWKEAEQQQVIARVKCVQIAIPFSPEQLKHYNALNKRDQYKYASTNPNKLYAVNMIINKHKDTQVLIIGQYIEQLSYIASQLDVPLVTGQTPQKERQQLFNQFRLKKLNILVLSKIANLALNLPNASIAIQVSGSYGSRQEEAQRVGRIIRPKKENNFATFYTIITSKSVEEHFALNRGRFLEEQGYSYELMTTEQLSIKGGEQIDSLINP